MIYPVDLQAGSVFGHHPSFNPIPDSVKCKDDKNPLLHIAGMVAVHEVKADLSRRSSFPRHQRLGIERLETEISDSFSFRIVSEQTTQLQSIEFELSE